MSSISSQVEPYKLRSRRCRKRALESLDRGDEAMASAEFALAAAEMEGAIAFLDELGAPNPESNDPAGEADVEVATQLADCWGMLGGVHRAAGNLDRSIQAYDQGFRFEGSPRFRILSTYNRVNRLVVRILAMPVVLTHPAPPVELHDGSISTVPELLEGAVSEVRRQLRAGRKDRPWALADLVLVSTLSGLDGAEPALRELGEQRASDPYPLQSLLHVVRELAALAIAPRNELVRLGEFLRDRLPEEMKGGPVAPRFPVEA